MTMRPNLTFVAIALLGLALPLEAQPAPGDAVAADERVDARSYVMPETGEEIPYAIFVPGNYDPSRSWPLVIGLHGLGSTFDRIMAYEGFVDMAARDGYIAVTPKGYHRAGWYGSLGEGSNRFADRSGEDLPDNLGALSEADVMHVLHIVREEFNVDDDRIYLWGHSMGGAGTYHLASKYPDIWAAVAVAAPAPLRSTDRLADMRDIPILVLHGDEDTVVPVDSTRNWVDEMEALGMQHVYIEVDGGDHSRIISGDWNHMSKLFSFFNIARKDQRAR